MVKLVLFSEQNEAQSAVKTRLIDLIDKDKPTIGYISSCPDPLQKFYEQTKEYDAQFEASLTPYVDLESGFDRSYLELVFQADAIYLSGGNIYINGELANLEYL